MTVAFAVLLLVVGEIAYFTIPPGRLIFRGDSARPQLPSTDIADTADAEHEPLDNDEARTRVPVEPDAVPVAHISGR